MRSLLELGFAFLLLLGGAQGQVLILYTQYRVPAGSPSHTETNLPRENCINTHHEVRILLPPRPSTTSHMPSFTCVLSLRKSFQRFIGMLELKGFIFFLC